MTYFTGLDRVARSTGYPVIEVKGWETRGHGGMNTVQTIVCHHTVGPKAGNAPSLNVVTNGRPGLPGPLAQFVLGRDGTIYVVAAGLSYHAGSVRKTAYGNSHALGIEAENTGTGEKWSDAQLDSYAKLCAALVKEFGLSVNDVLGHKEVCYPAGRKIDPNFSGNGLDMDDFRRFVKAGGYKNVSPSKPTAVKPTASKPTASKPTKKPAAAKSDSATKSVQSYLKALGFYTGLIDGIPGSMTKAAVKAYQANQNYFPGMKVDGNWGAMTQAHMEWVKSLQSALNKWRGSDIAVDGNLGSGTVARIKDVMTRNRGGAYKGIIDGVPGPMFCKMLGIKKHPSA